MDIKIDLSFLDDVEDTTQKMIQEVQEDESFFAQYVAPLQLSEPQFEEYITIFYKMHVERKNCAHCPGLAHCPNEIVGMLSHVKKDGDLLQRTFSECRLAKEEKSIENAFLYRQYAKKEYENLTLESMRKYDELDLRARALRVQLSNKIKRHNDQWIYIYGDKKSGKSQFASAYANDYAKKGLGTVAYISYKELLKYLTEIQYKDKKSYETLLQELSQASLLVFDGFGESYLTKSISETFLIPLLLSRLEEHKETMILTKYVTEELLDLLSGSTKAGRIIWSPIVENIKAHCARENGKKYMFKLNALII